MKLVTYIKDGHEQLAVLLNEMAYDMESIHPDLPNTMSMFLNYWEDAYPLTLAWELMMKEGIKSSNKGIAVSQVELIAPVPFPTSCRDGYAFRQHGYDTGV
jgi:fumarylacetoacetate (FAA) hydrolase